MNEENYAEWIVKRKDPVYAIPVKVIMVVLCVFALIIAMGSIVGAIFLLALLALTYFVFLNLSVEFEYTWIDGDLAIDRILSKARRRKVLKCQKEEIQFVAPSDSYMLKDYEKNGMKVKDCSSGQPGASTYSLIYQRGSECVKVIFEPNEKMLRSMRLSIPGKMPR